MIKKESKKMKSYHFDVGDSSRGPLGLCARVDAESREQALERLRNVLDDTIEIATSVHGPGIEYVNVYINEAAITVNEIDEEEEKP